VPDAMSCGRSRSKRAALKKTAPTPGVTPRVKWTSPSSWELAPARTGVPARAPLGHPTRGGDAARRRWSRVEKSLAQSSARRRRAAYDGEDETPRPPMDSASANAHFLSTRDGSRIQRVEGSSDALVPMGSSNPRGEPPSHLLAPSRHIFLPRSSRTSCQPRHRADALPHRDPTRTSTSFNSPGAS